MYGYIYQIQIKDYYYYGSTKNPQRRSKDHLYRLKNNKHDNIFMQSVYKKHKKYKFIVVATVIVGGSLMNIEQHFIDTFYGNSHCMNINENADRPPSSWGRIVSDETRKKLSESLKGKKKGSPSNLTKSKVSKANGSVVIVKDATTGSIFEYRSARFAAKHFNISSVTISSWCRGTQKNTKYPHLTFSYCSEKKSKILNARNKKVLVEIDPDTTKVYESAKSAAHDLQVSYHALRNWCLGISESTIYPNAKFSYFNENF